MARWCGVVLASRSIHLWYLLSEMAAAWISFPVDEVQLYSQSLRRGDAPMAYEAGVPLDVIMQHGRWCSNTLLAYMKESVQVRMERRFSRCERWGRVEAQMSCAMVAQKAWFSAV